MANTWEKAISILAGNLNLSHSYPITTVCNCIALLHALAEHELGFWNQGCCNWDIAENFVGPTKICDSQISRGL